MKWLTKFFAPDVVPEPLSPEAEYVGNLTGQKYTRDECRSRLHVMAVDKEYCFTKRVLHSIEERPDDWVFRYGDSIRHIDWAKDTKSGLDLCYYPLGDPGETIIWTFPGADCFDETALRDGSQRRIWEALNVLAFKRFKYKTRDDEIVGCLDLG